MCLNAHKSINTMLSRASVIFPNCEFATFDSLLKSLGSSYKNLQHPESSTSYLEEFCTSLLQGISLKPIFPAVLYFWRNTSTILRHTMCAACQQRPWLLPRELEPAPAVKNPRFSPLAPLPVGDSTSAIPQHRMRSVPRQFSSDPCAPLSCAKDRPKPRAPLPPGGPVRLAPSPGACPRAPFPLPNAWRVLAGPFVLIFYLAHVHLFTVASSS